MARVRAIGTHPDTTEDSVPAITIGDSSLIGFLPVEDTAVREGQTFHAAHCPAEASDELRWSVEGEPALPHDRKLHKVDRVEIRPLGQARSTPT
jgi:hypothetical protein